MSHTNSTTNYSLPQFITTDKPAWLTDINQAYTAIDTAMKNNADAAGNAQSDATQALSDASSAATTASTADSKGSGAIASIAPQFDNTATYDVGDMVVYNNLLYTCTVAVAYPGDWTGSANWSRKTLSSAISDITVSSINDLSDVDTTNVQANDLMQWKLVDNVLTLVPVKRIDVIGLSNASVWTALNEAITAGSSYTVLADGLYQLRLVTADTRAAEWSINGYGVIANTNSTSPVVVGVYLKAGTIISTRNIAEQTYSILGYWSI